MDSGTLHVEILASGADRWNAWRGQHPETVPTLQGVALANVDLAWADLRGVNLSGADLREAQLNGVNLREASLAGADLRGADLTDAT
ncbi:MAG: pentapeptide repeat-containing protein [Oscillatoriales cyanobacterium SM2_1_8]|nr:pentapeptide repeat-containing protein [Oscillatoriales cyanobacterium SM2_1_8]